MLSSLFFSILLSIPTLEMDDDCSFRGQSYYYNAKDSSVVFEASIKESIITDNTYDIARVKAIESIDSSAMFGLGPILYSDSYLDNYSFFNVGRIMVHNSICSHVILAVIQDGTEKCLFLVNTKNGLVTSVLTLSRENYNSKDNDYKSYTSLNTDVFSVFEKASFLDDEITDQEEGIRIPFYMQICSWFSRLFSKKNKFHFLFSVRLDSNGYFTPVQ